ncbi:MAG: 3'(2'),5'-bisphosphate nucleotidase CysQ [Gammaproteobacteria bacterium]|nr:3'(2'),5'-bisphosphate nucleotidase CysQ [Gammaproteobacteria bacterium]
MDDASLGELLDQVTQITKAAGRAILDVYKGEFHVDYKEDASPVTLADTRAHEIIVKALRGLETNYPIVSEEGGIPPLEQRQHWIRYWLVDPLDGTREFINRNGEFTVNIALVDGHQVILGVVYAPWLDVTYCAARGLGAFKNEGVQERKAIQVARHGVAESWRVVVSRSHMSKQTERFIQALGDVECLSLGSSLKLCLVAEGRAHLYPRLAPTFEWDTAAAQCVVEQAGGEVLSLDLSPLRYNARDTLQTPGFVACGEVGNDWRGHLKEFGSE